jgi:acyl dehydratase
VATIYEAENLRRFDALRVGERRASLPYVLSEAEMIAFAESFDPQWFHTDPAAAGNSAFGGLIASGVHLLALWRRMDHEINGDIAYQCGVALEHVAFRLAARPQDQLVLHSEITALRPSSAPGRGVVTMDYRMENQHRDKVLTLTAINLVYR